MNNFIRNYQIEPPFYGQCEKVPHGILYCSDNWKEKLLALEDNWYSLCSSGGCFTACIKNHEIIHSYSFAMCSGALVNEYHKEGEQKDWESAFEYYQRLEIRPKVNNAFKEYYGWVIVTQVTKEEVEYVHFLYNETIVKKESIKDFLDRFGDIKKRPIHFENIFEKK